MNEQEDSVASELQWSDSHVLTIDPKLLELLVCPQIKGPLRYHAQTHELISDQARLAYPIRDDIPIMVIEEARHLDENEVSGHE